MGFIEKAKAFVHTHPDRTRTGISRAGAAVNQRTRGRYSRQIGQGQRILNQKLGLGRPRPGRDAPTGRNQANP